MGDKNLSSFCWRWVNQCLHLLRDIWNYSQCTWNYSICFVDGPCSYMIWQWWDNWFVGQTQMPSKSTLFQAQILLNIFCRSFRMLIFSANYVRRFGNFVDLWWAVTRVASKLKIKSKGRKVCKCFWIMHSLIYHSIQLAWFA